MLRFVYELSSRGLSSFDFVIDNRIAAREQWKPHDHINSLGSIPAGIKYPVELGHQQLRVIVIGSPTLPQNDRSVCEHSRAITLTAA